MRTANENTVHKPSPLHFQDQARRLLEEIDEIRSRRFGPFGGPVSQSDNDFECTLVIERALRGAADTFPVPRSAR